MILTFLIGLSGAIVGSSMFLLGAWAIHSYQQKEAAKVANSFLEKLLAAKQEANMNVANQKVSNSRYN